jgi:RNA polymerase sigma-70 factor (ECF subfamily)
MSTDAEQRLREAFEAGDVTDALAETVQVYGPEVLGFLVSRLRNQDAANDAFALTCESLCSTIDDFGWRCSMRTWMYKLARTAVSRYQRAPGNRAQYNIALSQVSEIADRLRTQTHNYLRTEIKDRFAQLREELEPDDQTLLILRVDRSLDWGEVALVLSDGDLDEAEKKRVAARLRQRFQSVKQRLRERAIASGLLTDTTS